MRLKEPLKHLHWLAESLYRSHTANQSDYYWKMRREVQEMLERLDRLRLHADRTLPHQVRGRSPAANPIRDLELPPPTISQLL